MANVRDVTWRFINMAPIMGNQSALDDLFAKTLDPFGADRFDCGFVPEPRHPDIVSDHGLADWKQYYIDQRYYDADPCGPAHGQFASAYTWTDVKTTTDGQIEAPIWSDARAGGMCEGLIVPLALGRVTEAAVRLTTPEDRFDPDIMVLLQSISVIYASSTMSLNGNVTNAPALAKCESLLKDREVECLHWSARGKTNAEIGAIIGISRHTVNTHIENAKKKLGVATRMQAAAIAHQLGLLSIA
jgi:DNA-binding CsgD family transcriptional regulator